MYPIINMQQTGIKIKQIMDERNVSVKQIPIDAMICGNRTDMKLVQANDKHVRLMLYYTKLRELQAA